jgi:hypothetical protein
MPPRSTVSVHAALVAAAAAMVWCWPFGTGHRVAGTLARAAAVVVAAASLWSRAAAGVQGPGELLAGAGIGIAVGALLVGTAGGQAWIGRVEQALCGRAGSRMAAAGLVLAACALHVARHEHPLAAGLQEGLAAIGLVAALAWWRRHDRAPSRRLVRPPERAR